MDRMKISTVSQMRNMDRRAIEEFGIPDVILMENAGNAVSRVILENYQSMGIDFSSLRFAVFAGSGNNGGDGFVVARKLLSFGADVRVFFLGSIEKLKGSALSNYEILKQLKINVVSPSDFVSSEDFLNEAEAYVEGCNGIIDAILGTGITREVSGLYAEVIDLINRFGKAFGKDVFSVDIPSGINGDNAMVMGKAVNATHTVTFGLAKIGNILYPGYEYCGRLYVSHISFPPVIYNDESLQVEINIPAALPPRNPNGHKGSFGDVLFIAGARNYYGAPLFSALSFMKAGGGYARLATPESVAPFISMRGSEIVMIPLSETESGSISYTNLEKLLGVAQNVDFVVIGPGLSLNEETARLVRDFVARVGKPVLIDGDGLTALAGSHVVTHSTEVTKSSGVGNETGSQILDPKILEREYPTILTPHPGEAARLIDADIGEIISDRVKALNRIFEVSGIGKPGIVVLKGAHSLIGVNYGEDKRRVGGSERLFVNLSGNSGMATAGSGDVLTGIIAAMFSLGLDVVEAVKAGVFLHGFAGDVAAEHVGEDSVTASTIMEFIPEALKGFRENYSEIFKDYYGYIREI